VSVQLSLLGYFFLGFALIVLGRTIHYLAVTRYLRERGIVATGDRWRIRDWSEWSVYRKARLADHQPLTWWYVLWALQIVVFIWMIGWFASFGGALKFGTPTYPSPGTTNVEGYTTVFDVTHSGYRQWSFPAFGLVFVAVGLALPMLMRIGIFAKPPAWMQKWFARFFLGFAIFWTTICFIATYADYRRAVNAMRNNRAQLIEGVVTDFKPMPYTGHAMESFVVQGVRFEYSDYVITAGFNNTSSHGGPVREGLPVKIWYLGGEILRLDVKKRPNQSMKPTTPLRTAFSMFATTPSTSSRFPASLVRFASSRSRTPAVSLFNDSRGLSLSR
jgi:hypothetical protein